MVALVVAVAAAAAVVVVVVVVAAAVVVVVVVVVVAEDSSISHPHMYTNFGLRLKTITKVSLAQQYHQNPCQAPAMFSY